MVGGKVTVAGIGLKPHTHIWGEDNSNCPICKEWRKNENNG